MNKKMRILAIETSCDETAAAVVENGRRVLSSVISSQIALHRPFHGVVPELASRAHVEHVNSVVEKGLTDAGLGWDSIKERIDAVAYTRGPGLAGALLVGQLTAQTIAYRYGIPLIDMNHLEGHLYAALLEHPRLAPPFLSLVVSGGHTELIYVEDYGRYKILGGTRDDAAGEAFDKVAKLLGLPYPGGPVIDRLAREGDASAIPFPRPFLKGTWDFSFSGLKTSVVNFVRAAEKKPGARQTRDICASFQRAVVETLVTKTIAAARHCGTKVIVVGGGVAANESLREFFKRAGKKERISVYLPSLSYCTDNAAMIGGAAYFKALASGVSLPSAMMKIEPGMKLQNWNIQ